MKPILVYGHPLGSSMGLVSALEWLGQPYMLCRVDMLSEMKNNAYARINRRLETPALITDEGQLLTETMAIALWLEARDKERRISFSPITYDADRMHQIMAFLNTGFTGAFSPLWTALEMESPDPLTLEILRKYGRESVIERHDRLEEQIGTTEFLIGNKPSLADAVFIGVARWLDFHEVENSSRWPKIEKLRRTLETTPAVQFATAIERGETPEGSGAFHGHVPLTQVIEEFGKPID
ncbi:MAG: glutathione S-transferase [Cellvibrio sp. 79]|nr:MAG: glutathione S-transferase [Cellvibrio sp. 79]